jgi:hypothetical protein
MADIRHVATFSREAFRGTVKAMELSGEEVHHKGEKVFRTTGQLDPMVNIHGERRLSRNAMVREGDQFLLPHGPKLPLLFGVDGTGSMGGNVAKAFYAMEAIDAMLAGVRTRYQTDISFAVLQDVDDRHPVYQMAQFESDQRIANHVRLLIPDKSGGDEPEDYDLGLAYVLLATETDIFDFYGLKGYFMIVGDQIGRGAVYPEGVQRHLGHSLQTTIQTSAICKALLDRWHLFFVQVGSGFNPVLQSVTSWWRQRLGEGRVVTVPEPDFLAEVQAGLVYVSENEQPTEKGLVDFLLAGGANIRIDDQGACEVWRWLQAAQPHFGAQARLSGHSDLPKPGDIFAHYRHPWPIGHPREGENVTPDDTETPAPSGESDKIEWGKF